MFWDIFKIKSTKFLGVDIGNSSIKIVEIEKSGRRPRLINYGQIEMPLFESQPFKSLRKNALSLSDENIAEAIGAVLDEAGIRTREANFSIPDFCSFFTGFELPAMNKEEISKAVFYQVRPLIPLPLEEVSLDWSIIKGKPSKTPLKILVVAIPNEVIAQYQKIADLVGLRLKFLESEVFALARSLVDENKNKKVIGLVDIGDQSTTCSIVEENILKTSHSFNIAGSELTKVIDRSLGIEYNKAEDLKKRYGLLSSAPSFNQLGGLNQNERLEGKTLPKVLSPLMDSILEEIKRVFRDFYRSEGKEVERVVLSGGTALMPGLKEYFKNELRKEVVQADPFSHIDFPPVLKQTLKNLGPVYGIAIGLALKGLE
jgi:type IV pilus assembly protein PilM